MLEGRYGRALADARRPTVAWLTAAVFHFFAGDESLADARRPTVAWLTAAVFHFFAGDESLPAAGEMLAALPPGELFVGNAPAWSRAFETAWPGGVQRQRRLRFDSHTLERDHVERLAARVPDGWQVVPLDASLAARMAGEVSSDLILADVFDSPDAFVRDGLGFAAVRGGRPASAATSAFVAAGSIEIQVNTRPEQRGIGLATAVSARLIAACLERGWEPHWDTADATSERLALRLGYTPADHYEWLQAAAGVTSQRTTP